MKRRVSYKEMQPPHQRSRVNLDELKARLVKKLGPKGSKQYFYCLQRFLNLKFTKVELDKLCLRVLGRENIPLHNQLIHSILRNAFCVKSPPPASHKDDPSKHATHVGNQEIPSDGFQQNGSRFGRAQASCLSNGGDLLPVSPRKARSGSCDRRSGDRRISLGPNGMTSSHQLSTAAQPVMQNGVLDPPYSGRPVQQAEDPAKMPIVRRSPGGPAVVNREDCIELVVRNNGKEASLRGSLEAPLGVLLCPVSRAACRALPASSSGRSSGMVYDGSLLDSHALKERMGHIALAQGLEGVSLDCANILNQWLDSYIKGLLSSCIELVGARSGHQFTKNFARKNHASMELINGVKPGYQYHMPNNSTHHYQMQEQKALPPISLQEFRVVMELNPRQLGEDWPMLLEKICTRAFEG